MEDRRAGSPIYTEESSMLIQIGKYWGHGILYSILLAIALIPLLSVLLISASIGIIGLILGMAVLFLAIGWLNKIITGFIWKIECRGSWKSLTGHGLGLVAGLLLISIPLVFVEIFFYYSLVLYYVISFGAVPIIQGVVAKYVASYFTTSDASVAFPSAGRRPSRGPMATCPYCNAVFPYREIDLSLEGTAPCRTCGAIIQDPRYGPGGTKRPGHPRNNGFDPEPSRDQDDTLWR